MFVRPKICGTLKSKGVSYLNLKKLFETDFWGDSQATVNQSGIAACGNL